MFKAVLTALLTAATVSGCVLIPTSLYNNSERNQAMEEENRSYAILPPPPTEVPGGQENVYRYNYVLNEQRIARTGDAVLRVQGFKSYEFLSSKMILEQKAEAYIDAQKVAFAPGEYPIYGIIDPEKEPYFLLPSRGNLFPVVDMHGVLQTFFMYRVNGEAKVSPLRDRAKLTPRLVRFKRVVKKRENTIPFTDYEVVYDGIKNNMISLFVKDNVPGSNGAQGSFDTLSFPKDSTMISVRGALIRIIRADREKLDYIVMTNPK